MRAMRSVTTPFKSRRVMLRGIRNSMRAIRESRCAVRARRAGDARDARVLCDDVTMPRYATESDYSADAAAIVCREPRYAMAPCRQHFTMPRRRVML